MAEIQIPEDADGGDREHYGLECEGVRKLLGAQGCVLLVLGGERGHGISVVVSKEMRPSVLAMLREAARRIEQDLKNPTIPCPVCSAEYRVPDRIVSKGDLMVCRACCSFLIFMDATTVRLMTDEEIIELSDDLRIEMMRTRREMEQMEQAEKTQEEEEEGR